ncbi:MAG: dihydroorotase [Deltaproteobacteria bacterium]|jgi:dihydroorotase|nr:dihydroorotase [Deltaproteobacteria bacterium]
MGSKNTQEKVTVIVGGTVIDPSSNLHKQTNIFIEDGMISEISDRSPVNSDGVLNAEGLCIAPGFIDLHTHLRDPGFEYKEDIESGSRAALAGGFTTIVCMPNTNPVNDCAEVTKGIIRRAKDVGLINILPVGAMTVGLKGERIPDYDAMIDAGIVAISDDGSCIQDSSVAREVFSIAAEKEILITSHPEIHSLSKGGIINDGEYAKINAIPGIPRSAENEAIARDIELARDTGARLHLGHVSTKEGIAYVRKAKADSLHVTCEVTPHHLLLTEYDVDEYAANAKMNPPLRTDEDRIALIRGLQDGTVDAIATDHAPHSPDEKRDILTSPFGIIGMETAFPVCMELVEDEYLDIDRLIELFTISPSKIFHLNRGTISVGAIADLVIFQKDSPSRIESSKFQSKSRNTPFDGWEVSAEIKSVIVGGNMIAAS